MPAGENENSLKNLRPPWKEGAPSPNPKGRPKLPDLREVMAEILGEEKDGKTALMAIVSKLRQLAANGNIKAAEVLLQRGYGMPKQTIEQQISTASQINISKDGENISLSIKDKPDELPT